MDDPISRLAAIEEINERIKANGYLNVALVSELNRLWGYISRLPSAQKNGKWIEDDDRIIAGHCSLCGWKAIYDETDVLGMPYCPNCGARMESE